MRISRIGWQAVYAVLCVCVGSTVTRAIYASHAFRETRGDDLPDGSGYEKRLIPIRPPRVGMKRLTTLPLEPDAEMLPAHYTGVKPPGVDHMELKYAESQVLKAASIIQVPGKSSQDKDTRQTSVNQNSEIEASDGGHQRVGSFEKGQKGDRLTKKHRTEYAEDGGKRKTHSDRDNDSGHEEERAGRRGGESHRRKNSGNVDHKATGYRNVYHKDEYNRDHDFYDNDDHGGHLKKHGRYNEKHIATEGTFKKGDGTDSSLDGAELHKEGIARSSRVEGESKGHDARRGYSGFFENLQELAKQGDKNEGKRFGFAEAKAR